MDYDRLSRSLTASVWSTTVDQTRPAIVRRVYGRLVHRPPTTPRELSSQICFVYAVYFVPSTLWCFHTKIVARKQRKFVLELLNYTYRWLIQLHSSGHYLIVFLISLYCISTCIHTINMLAFHPFRKGKSVPKFLSVSSSHECVPPVRSPPRVWHCAGVVTKTQP